MRDNSKSSAECLKTATLAILDERSATSSLRPEVLDLIEVFQNAGGLAADRSQDIGAGATLSSRGLALSPQMAAMCAEDYARTIAFIRGLNAAIEDSHSRISDRPARILYAGCGPYAALAVPLMSVWSPQEVSFELLDLHAESIDSAKTVIHALEFDGSVSAYRIMDAADYQASPDAPPDILVMEIMNACLEKEPQVSVTRRLLRQAPSAMIVPRSVKIDLRLVDMAKEFTGITLDKAEPAERERVPLGAVFELSRESILSWAEDTSSELPAGLIEIPSPLEERFQIMLFTTIVTHGSHRLEEYDSGLTVPRVLSFVEDIRGGDKLQFGYQLGSRPGLTCKRI